MMIVPCYLLIPVLHKAFDATSKYNKLMKTIMILICVIELGYCSLFNSQIVFLIFFAGFMFGKFRTKNIDCDKKMDYPLLTSSIITFILGEGLYVLFRNVLSSENSYLSGLLLMAQHYMAGLMGISFAIAFLQLFRFMNKFKGGGLVFATNILTTSIYITMFSSLERCR